VQSEKNLCAAAPLRSLRETSLRDITPAVVLFAILPKAGKFAALWN
jgi:hypothetical protein